MEYMEGKALSDLVHKSTAELEGEVLLDILRDASMGMQFLHNTKPAVVHGDLKTANILISSMYRAKSDHSKSSGEFSCSEPNSRMA